MQTVSSFSLDLNFEIAALFISVFMRKIDIGRIVVNLSNGNWSKFLGELVVADEKHSIICVFAIF